MSASQSLPESPESMALAMLLKAAGAVYGATPWGDDLLHFGDAAGEYAALESASVVFPLLRQTQIELTGDDRAAFLHNLCTNDIRKLAAGQGCEAFLCNAQGKILFHVQVFCRADSIVLETVPGDAERLLSHLDRYLIREKVELHDRSDAWCEFLLAGASATALKQLGIAAPLETMTHIDAAIVCVRTVIQPSGVGVDAHLRQSAESKTPGDPHVPVQVRRAVTTDPPGHLLCVPRTRAADVWDALLDAGARPAGCQVLEIARVEAGFPRYGLDIADDNLPQEVARDQRAISFTKGCYIGQETVARIDALGHVNRTLCGVRFEGNQGPQRGTELFLPEGKGVGRVTSAVFSPRLAAPLALAYIRRGSNRPGQRLTSPAGDAEVIQFPL